MSNTINFEKSKSKNKNQGNSKSKSIKNDKKLILKKEKLKNNNNNVKRNLEKLYKRKNIQNISIFKTKNKSPNNKFEKFNNKYYNSFQNYKENNTTENRIYLHKKKEIYLFPHEQHDMKYNKTRIINKYRNDNFITNISPNSTKFQKSNNSKLKQKNKNKIL